MIIIQIETINMVTTKSSTLHAKQTNVMMLPLSSHDTNLSSVDTKVRGKKMENFDSLGSRILILTLFILQGSIIVLCQVKSRSKNVYSISQTINIMYCSSHDKDFFVSHVLQAIKTDMV